MTDAAEQSTVTHTSEHTSHRPIATRVTLTALTHTHTHTTRVTLTASHTHTHTHTHAYTHTHTPLSINPRWQYSLTLSLMSSTAADRIVLEEIAVAEAEAVLCVLHAKKQLAQAKLDASLVHDSHLRREQTITASNHSSPSSASPFATDITPIRHLLCPSTSICLLLSPPTTATEPVLTSAKRNRAVGFWTTAPDFTRMSLHSASSSSSNRAQPLGKKRWRHHALLVPAKGT